MPNCDPADVRLIRARTVGFTAAVAALPPAAPTVRNPYRFGSIRAAEVPSPGEASATAMPSLQ
jgi:hypothetical protein